MATTVELEARFMSTVSVCVACRSNLASSAHCSSNSYPDDHEVVVVAGTARAFVAPTRRAVRREETLAEISDLAFAQLAEVGPNGLNLRAIARDMGMSSAAIYRYFESRDDLLVSLISQGFDSLGRELRAAVEASQDPPVQRLGDAFRRYRRWAHDQPQTFALLFTDPVPGFSAPAGGPTVDAVLRAMSPLVVVGSEALGVEVPPATEVATGTGSVVSAQSLPDATRSALLQMWASIHGFVCLEVFHHFDWADLDLSDAFNTHVDACLDRITANVST